MRALPLVLALLWAAPAWGGEHPAVQAAGANLWVERPPPHEASADLVLRDHRGRVKDATNTSAGVPGLTVIVEFPPDSAELDDFQREALYRLTREWRFTPHVRLLWIRAGADLSPYETGGDSLARRRAEALRRATGGKGFPWKRIFLDSPAAPCGAEECRRTNRQGVITLVMAR